MKLILPTENKWTWHVRRATFQVWKKIPVIPQILVHSSHVLHWSIISEDVFLEHMCWLTEDLKEPHLGQPNVYTSTRNLCEPSIQKESANTEPKVLSASDAVN